MNLVASVLSCYSSLKQLRRQDGSEISWAFDRALSRVFKRPFGLDLALGLNPAPQLWCWKRSRCNLWGEARGKNGPAPFPSSPRQTQDGLMWSRTRWRLGLEPSLTQLARRKRKSTERQGRGSRRWLSPEAVSVKWKDWRSGVARNEQACRSYFR